MPYFRRFDLLIIILDLFLIFGGLRAEEGCNKIPLGSKTAALPPDDRFIVEIVGLVDKYIPGKTYEVHLYSKDEKAKFIAFTVLVKGDEKPNLINPRKPTLLDAGKLGILEESNDVIVNTDCTNVLIQSNLTPKTSIKAKWIAPPKGNQCVTLSAVVAIKQDVWFSSEGPLSKRVCEDLRKAEDMQPSENKNCEACGDARYLLTFEGTWSPNTHPNMYPDLNTKVRFSDVVGAAHNKKFNVYKYNSEATEGLKMLAEQGNTTVLEKEIIIKLGEDVRTVIKATGPPSPNMTTEAMFRVSPEHHLVSLVSAVLPSPDWFLGVANFELCDAIKQEWTQNSLLNLYLMDAGTDSGVTFTAANEVTSPPQPISSADITKQLPKEQLKPFAILKFDLIRTYEGNIDKCRRKYEENRETEFRTIQEETESSVSPTEAYNPPPPPVVPSDPSDPCPMTEWESWLPCEGECGETGTQMRTREPILNNVPMSSYGENAQLPQAELPKECSGIETSEFQECKVYCEEDSQNQET